MILLHCLIEDTKTNNVSKIQHNIEVCCLYNPDLASSCVCLHLQARTGQKSNLFYPGKVEPSQTQPPLFQLFTWCQCAMKYAYI